MKSKLFIPKKLKVGFDKRNDTFTGKLAYVIYFDEKNKLRKEASWQSWRDHDIEPIEYENIPQNGFILNKGIQRFSDWGSSRAVVRVFDSRDFEFEISIDNLLGILMHSDVSKRDIIEQCVFAWHGQDLILLPCNSVEYQESVEYTAKQDMKVSTKELVLGCQYHKKKTDEILTYIGRFDWWEFKTTNGKRYGDEKLHTNKGKKHIFWDGKYFKPISPSILSGMISEDAVENYAFLVDEWFKTINSQSIKAVKVIPYKKIIDDTQTWREYPTLGIFENNEMKTINTRHYLNDTFATMNFSQYTKRVTFNDSVLVEIIKYPRTTGYYQDSYDTSLNVNSIIHSQLKLLAISNGYDYLKLLPSQYVKMMTDLGYGIFNYVLQNDTEVEEPNNWYWY